MERRRTSHAAAEVRRCRRRRTKRAATGLYDYRHRGCHAQLGRFVTRDPVGADINLYRYCGDMPLAAVDPTGDALKWTQSVVGEPVLRGSTGFRMQVRQVLSTGGRPAVAGTQTWQTNDVKFLALIRTNNKCVWDNKHRNRLDVHAPKGAPPYIFTDTIDAEYDAKGARVCFLFVAFRRRLGLRPYNINKRTGTIRFLTDPLREGNNYDATEEEWALAHRMIGPVLKSSVDYVFIDKEALRCCSKEKQEHAEMFFKTAWGGELGAGIGSAAVLSYEGLGEWSAQWGRETTLPPVV